MTELTVASYSFENVPNGNPPKALALAITRPNARLAELTPTSNCFISWTRSFIWMLNNSRDNKQPCFKPHFTSKKSVDRPFIHTQLLASLYKEIMALYKHPHRPISFSLVQSIWCRIESYAFEKSMKETNVSFFMALRVSMTDVTVDKWSRVLLDFLVRSIPPEPFERFSLNFGQMFASVSQCAEPISQPCQLKVKVTGQGHVCEPWISCPLHISYIPGRIFFKLWSYVCLSETMCRTHNATMPTQGQGHSSGSQVWAVNLVSALYLLYQWKDFL